MCKEALARESQLFKCESSKPSMVFQGKLNICLMYPSDCLSMYPLKYCACHEHQPSCASCSKVLRLSRIPMRDPTKNPPATIKTMRSKALRLPQNVHATLENTPAVQLNPSGKTCFKVLRLPPDLIKALRACNVFNPVNRTAPATKSNFDPHSPGSPCTTPGSTSPVAYLFCWGEGHPDCRAHRPKVGVKQAWGWENKVLERSSVNWVTTLGVRHGETTLWFSGRS